MIQDKEDFVQLILTDSTPEVAKCFQLPLNTLHWRTDHYDTTAFPHNSKIPQMYMYLLWWKNVKNTSAINLETSCMENVLIFIK